MVPSGICLQISREKQNLTKTDRPSHMDWQAPPKVLWKTTTNIKVSFTEMKVYILNKVLHFKVSAVY